MFYNRHAATLFACRRLWLMKFETHVKSQLKTHIIDIYSRRNASSSCIFKSNSYLPETGHNAIRNYHSMSARKFENDKNEK